MLLFSFSFSPFYFFVVIKLLLAALTYLLFEELHICYRVCNIQTNESSTFWPGCAALWVAPFGFHSSAHMLFYLCCFASSMGPHVFLVVLLLCYIHNTCQQGLFSLPILLFAFTMQQFKASNPTEPIVASWFGTWECEFLFLFLHYDH